MKYDANDRKCIFSIVCNDVNFGFTCWDDVCLLHVAYFLDLKQGIGSENTGYTPLGVRCSISLISPLDDANNVGDIP